MEDPQKFNAIPFQTINEAIAPKNDLPNGRTAIAEEVKPLAA